MEKKRFVIPVAIAFFMIAALLAAGFYQGIQYESVQNEVSYLLKSVSPIVFIALMIILPGAGFPVSVFLIMSGIKFGIFYAAVLWLLVLPLHALMGYYLSGKLRKTIVRFSEKRGYHIPKAPEKNIAMYSFLFYAVPGLPYAGKNYLLPLAGVPFTHCVLMNSLVQAPQGIPFIILGRSVTELDLRLFYLALIMFIMLFVLLLWLKRRYWNTIHGP